MPTSHEWANEDFLTEYLGEGRKLRGHRVAWPIGRKESGTQQTNLAIGSRQRIKLGGAPTIKNPAKRRDL
jgi:hypothetical protein